MILLSSADWDIIVKSIVDGLSEDLNDRFIAFKNYWIMFL